jgi:four helix bundle protein
VSGERLPARAFTDLLVWQKAHDLVLEIYRLSQGFPKQEIYGLTSQLRRASVSIPANIAEGFRKRGTADKARFFNIAEGSIDEVRYYLILVNDLRYADSTALLCKLDEVSRLLRAYARKLRNSNS